jgi:hypothetical protein
VRAIAARLPDDQPMQGEFREVGEFAISGKSATGSRDRADRLK